MKPNNHRNLDGAHNNQEKPDWGMSGTPIMRKTPHAYSNNIDSFAQRIENSKHNLPGPREASNSLCVLHTRQDNPNSFSDFVWAWGQLLDHELTSTPLNPTEKCHIPVSSGDPTFPQGGQIPYFRSEHAAQTGTSPKNPREQINQTTSFIDASVVYGQQPARMRLLRMRDGTGRLAHLTTDKGDFLPLNISALENEFEPPTASPERFFLAGDRRVNENIVLISLQTLLLREHNRLCEIIMEEHPEYEGNDENIFHLARKIIGAIMQVITYNEYLPTLLGKNALSSYQGYNPKVNPAICNMFSSACFKVTPAGLPSTLKIPNNKDIIQLKDAFYNPELVLSKGIEAILSGRYSQKMKKIDLQVTDDVRSFPFFTPPNSQFQTFHDLAAITIQRGRDHGLCDYNTARKAFGLKKVSSFEEITNNTDIQAKLHTMYHSVDNIDPWIGALAEETVPGALVGPLMYIVIKDQFERCRDGDRFWYQADPVLENYSDLVDVKLSDLIKRNTLLDNVPKNVFVVGRRKRHLTRY